ncbi:DUF624 domain-containing protein [Arthrobacter sp. M4]|uniref:DUF624 domain-containing protein n=1 Tax=Arthrobacter sp. M4 TaxID=218160 RepID=UPI001CDC03EF|nr:DUF624 domain-containing protein [Arthrobacter sp. M4]MCA4134284.1 DUF624 domain-containing protein [Arthrobacter sp. M4]
MTTAKTEFGTGPLFRAASLIYGVMVCHLLLVLVNLPLVLSPLLVSLISAAAGSPASTTAAVAVVLLCCLPLGPAVVAAAATCNKIISATEGSVARLFLRALKGNAREALAVWVPAFGVFALLAFNLLNLGAASTPVDPALRVCLLLLAVLVCTVTINALVIVSRFRFRTIDVFRLAFSCLGAQKRASLGNAAIIVLGAWALAQTSVFVLLFTAGAVVYLVCLNSRPLLRFVEDKFTTAA